MNNKSEEYIEMLMEKMNKTNEIKSNPTYINWLEKFTEKYPHFSDDDFLYHKKNKKKDDIEKVKNLDCLYRIIDKYAQDNYIYQDNDEKNTISYKIKYNNIGYEIGVMYGQGTFFFCDRLNYIDGTFIDFNDILNNIKQPNTDKINQLFEKINIIIEYYYNEGVPLPAITRNINEVMTLLNKEEKERKEKKLNKKYEN